MFHQKLSMLAAAAAAALAVFPSLSQAVELGDLKVVSQPGPVSYTHLTLPTT